jgi:hypothetical protein
LKNISINSQNNRTYSKICSDKATRAWPECNVFTNCHGPQCCSRVSTGVFGKSNRNLEYVIIFYNISVTSENVINLIIFPYKHPKIDLLAAYNSRTGNGLVKNSVLPSAAISHYTRSYYRKENAASPPREGTMHNLLNKGLFIRSRFARTRYEAG